MSLIYKRILCQRMSIRGLRYSKHKALLATTTLANRLIGNLTSPRTLRLAYDSEVALTLANDLALIVFLDYIWQLPPVLCLLAVVDTSPGSTWLWNLPRIQYDDIETLGQREGDETILALLDRAEYFASTRLLKPYRRI